MEHTIDLSLSRDHKKNTELFMKSTPFILTPQSLKRNIFGCTKINEISFILIALRRTPARLG